MLPAIFFGGLWELEKIALGIAQVTLARILYFAYEVNRVALVAGDAVAGVFRMVEEILLLAGVMAGEAAGGVFFRLAVKSKNGMFHQGLGCFSVVAVRCLDCVAVRFSRTVAGFATVDIILARENDLGVTCLFILQGFVLVAVLAGFRTCKLAGGRTKHWRATGNRRALNGFRALLGGASSCQASDK